MFGRKKKTMTTGHMFYFKTRKCNFKQVLVVCLGAIRIITMLFTNPRNPEGTVHIIIINALDLKIKIRKMYLKSFKIIHIILKHKKHLQINKNKLVEDCDFFNGV